MRNSGRRLKPTSRNSVKADEAQRGRGRVTVRMDVYVCMCILFVVVAVVVGAVLCPSGGGVRVGMAVVGVPLYPLHTKAGLSLPTQTRRPTQTLEIGPLSCPFLPLIVPSQNPIVATANQSASAKLRNHNHVCPPFPALVCLRRGHLPPLLRVVCPTVVLVSAMPAACRARANESLCRSHSLR